MSVSNGLKGMWQEAAMARMKVLTQYFLSKRTVEYDKNTYRASQQIKHFTPSATTDRLNDESRFKE
jgi:hypothetical protein